MSLRKDEVLSRGKAIARPIDPAQFDSTLNPSNEIHKEIYQAMENMPGHITKPSKIREHQKTESSPVKKEFLQTLYPDALDSVGKTGMLKTGPDHSVEVQTQDKLKFIDEVFETLESFATFGITHRDIKPPNILLGEDKTSYVHDFDLVKKDCLSGTASPYIYWDAAGKMGIATPASDVVGGLMTCFELVFKPPPEFHKDNDHSGFKNGLDAAVKKYIEPGLKDRFLKLNEGLGDNFIELEEGISLDQAQDLLSEALNTKPLNPQQKEAVLRLLLDLNTEDSLLEMMCNVFDKEKELKDELVGSCIAHFTGMTEEAFLRAKDKRPDLIQNKFYQGVDKELYPKIWPLIEKAFPDDCQNMKDMKVWDLIAELDNHQNKSDYLTPEEFKNYEEFANQMDVLDGIYSNLNHIESSFDPVLFANLHSIHPEERQEGIKEVFEIFYSPTEIREKLKAMQDYYKEELENLTR